MNVFPAGVPHRPGRRALLAGACALPLAALAPARTLAQDGKDGNGAISPVEQWLFLDRHLDRLKLPSSLRYRLDGSGSPDGEHHDDMELQLAQDPQHKIRCVLKTPRLDVAVPYDDEMPSNPIIVYFLDRDVDRMQRATGGQKRYFQRRLRLRLAATRTLEPVRVKVGARTIDAQQVTVRPFLDDPLKDRFPTLAGKRYTFVLSTQVPGRVVSLRAAVPGAADDFLNPIESETLTLTAPV